MKKARVIITFNCKNNCSYCCNEQPNIKNSMKTLDSLETLKEYDEIIITGGEPALNTKRTKSIIEIINLHAPNSKIYLYTAYYSTEVIGWINQLVDLLDGIHFTLHKESDYWQYMRFQLDAFQIMQNEKRLNSFKLYIPNTIKREIKIFPYIWAQVEIKPWVKECLLPEDDLFLYLK